VTTAESTWQQAVGLMANAQYEAAADCARRALDDDPDHGRLWQVYGAARWLLQDYQVATAALETATTLVPLLSVPLRALADCYARLGKHDLAVQLYGRLIENGQTPTALLPGIAAALNGLGEVALALEACEVIVQRDPACHQAHFGLAYYQARLGAEPAELLEPLAMAHDLAPHILHYRINLAFVWAELRDFTLAGALLKAVDITTVRCPCWLVRMRAIFEQGGDCDGAQACSAQLRRLPQPPGSVTE